MKPIRCAFKFPNFLKNIWYSQEFSQATEVTEQSSETNTCGPKTDNDLNKVGLFHWSHYSWSLPLSLVVITPFACSQGGARNFYWVCSKLGEGKVNSPPLCSDPACSATPVSKLEIVAHWNTLPLSEQSLLFCRLCLSHWPWTGQASPICPEIWTQSLLRQQNMEAVGRCKIWG